MAERPGGSIFVVFLLLGFTIDAACFGLWSAANVVWVDFLHTNPNRSQANALTMLALSPIYGAVGAFGLNALPLIVGAIGAKLGSLRSGQVPFWVLVALLPACGLAFAIQGQWLFDSYEDGPQPSVWNVAAQMCVLQIPTLLGCWLWTRRPRRGALPPSIVLADQ